MLGTRRAKKEEREWGLLTARAARCTGKARMFFHLHRARAPFLLLEVRALQACAGRRGGAGHLTPERGRGRQQHRAGLVGGLPVHPEAVDAGVLGVAPVSQDAQLHHLVRGHFRILQRKGRAKNSDWRGEATPRARHPLPQASAEKPDFKNPVFRPWKSFQLVGQEAPEASEVLQELGTHVKAA